MHKLRSYVNQSCFLNLVNWTCSKHFFRGKNGWLELSLCVLVDGVNGKHVVVGYHGTVMVVGVVEVDASLSRRKVSIDGLFGDGDPASGGGPE